MLYHRLFYFFKLLAFAIGTLTHCIRFCKENQTTGSFISQFISKATRKYCVRGCCSNKEEGILLSVDFFKEKTNQHRTLHLDPQQAGFMVNRNQISVMVVPNCMNILKYTLIGYISLSNGEWRKII